MFLQWIPPPIPIKEQEAGEQIAIDMGDEYEQALSEATQEEIIDLAGKCILNYILWCIINYLHWFIAKWRV